MSFGRPYIMRTSGCIHDGWLVLSDKSGLFDQDYLYHFLSSDNAYRQFDQFASGSIVRNLNIDAAKRVKVFLPSISEQKRIVAILDEAFEGIDTAVVNTEKNLANARELFDSYLQYAFRDQEGWEERTLQQASRMFGRGKSRHRPRNDPSLYNGPYPFIQTGEVRNCNHVILESSSESSSASRS
jgi:type I restriction enzyme, S subunit